jgi:hypothetical protein
VKVGDIVKHKYGTLMGSGVVLNLRKADGGRARIAWTAHGETKIHDVATLFLEVVSATSR